MLLNYFADQVDNQNCNPCANGTEMDSDEFGAGIMGHNLEINSQKVIMHIENIELTYVGQAYR